MHELVKRRSVFGQSRFLFCSFISMFSPYDLPGDIAPKCVINCQAHFGGMGFEHHSRSDRDSKREVLTTA